MAQSTITFNTVREIGLSFPGSYATSFERLTLPELSSRCATGILTARERFQQLPNEITSILRNTVVEHRGTQ